MARYIIFFIGTLLLWNCRPGNHLNHRGERTGRWLVYLDSAKTIRSFKGRFRRGNPVGTARYYDMSGRLARKEKIRGNRSRTTLYDASGTVSDRGVARLEESHTSWHYYFEGWWKHYGADGKLEKLVLYEKGKIIRTKYVDASISLNDSLSFVLNDMEKRFLNENAKLLDSVNSSRYQPQRRERFHLEIHGQDTTTFHQLQQILARFGYPSEKLAGGSTNIPFFILSNAPLYLREKYIPLLCAAADEGKLSWKSLAFYLDKISVAKGEPQQFGTQFYFDGKGVPHDYPCVAQEQLILNRKRVGLD